MDPTVSLVWAIKLAVVTFDVTRNSIGANTFPAFARTASKGIHFAFVPAVRFLPFFQCWDRTGFIFGGIFILLSSVLPTLFSFFSRRKIARISSSKGIFISALYRSSSVLVPFVVFTAFWSNEFDPRITLAKSTSDLFRY